MKKVVSILLSLAMLLSITAGIDFSALAYTSEAYSYRVLNDGTAEITKCNFYASRFTIPSTLDGKTVTSIGYEAFSGCTGLTSITIPDSVTSIGDNAFSGCTGLTSITIPDSVTSIDVDAFKDCTGLKKVNIGSIESWSNIDFKDDDSNPLFYAQNLYLNDKLVTDLVIPDSVTSIGRYAFEDCTGLTSITIPDSVTSIGNNAFYGCTGLKSVKIGNSVTSIGSQAFDGCTGLTSITIPDSVTSIGDSAFINTAYYNNESNWENNVLYIGKHLIKAKDTISGNYSIKPGTKTIAGTAFRDCKGLTSITIPDSVTCIGNNAFDGCTGLTSVTMGNSVKSIGGSAFSGCKELKEVNISSIESWSNIDFKDDDSNPLFYAQNLYLNDKLVTDLVIPDGVTSIGSSPFYCCTGLTSVTIGNSVTSIGSYAFNGCTGLKKVNIGSIESWSNIDFKDDDSNPLYYAHNLYLNDKLVTDLVIPDSVTSIGRYAFEDCTGVTSVTIPNSVTSIGGFAFEGCTGLTNITIPDSVTSIEDNAFSGCKGLTSITIPDSVTSIGDNAFNDCTGLTSLDLGNGIKDLDVLDSFKSSTNLTTLTIGSGVKSFKNDVLKNFPNIKTVYLYSKDVDSTLNLVSSMKKGSTLYAFSSTNAKKYIGVYDVNIVILDDPRCDEDIHAYDETVIENATCVKPGKKMYRCRYCHNVKTETIPATGEHSYVSTVTTPASCSKEGVRTYTCSVCGNSYTEPIPMTEHTPAIDPEVAPTCTESGLTEGSHCSACGKVFKEQTVVPATGHTIVKDEAVEPTCTEKGKTEGSHCSVCGEILTKQEVVPALGHNYVNGVCARCGEKDPNYNKPVKPADDPDKPSTNPETPVTPNKPNNTNPSSKPAPKASNAKSAAKPANNISAQIKTFSNIPVKLKKVKKGKKSFTATWKNVAGVDGYQVQYSLKKNMKKSKTKTVNASKSKLTVKKLKKGKKYYVRIRAYKTINGKKVYGKWSAKKTVKVK